MAIGSTDVRFRGRVDVERGGSGLPIVTTGAGLKRRWFKTSRGSHSALFWPLVNVRISVARRRNDDPAIGCVLIEGLLRGYGSPGASRLLCVVDLCCDRGVLVLQLFQRWPRVYRRKVQGRDRVRNKPRI